jgi:uncharacterized protein YbjT (DUF2867 family)
MILVVGASGQLGTLVVQKLTKQGRPVRALVRSGRGVDALTGAELVQGDLREPAGLDVALDGVDAVVATANGVAPSRRGETTAGLARGYAGLVDRAAAAGVRRFVLASVPTSALDETVPDLRLKRLVERRLAGSGLSHLSVRFAPFTEVWLALVGSTVPDRGEVNSMLHRPYPFLARFRWATGSSVEDRGRLVLPGPADRRQAFISVHDAADVLVAGIDAPLAGAVDVGGPEVLSWTEVAAEFERVLGRPVRVVSLPAGAFRAARAALAPVAPSVANIMGLNLFMATADTDWDTTTTTDALGVGPLRTVRQVLAEKAALPAAQE